MIVLTHIPAPPLASFVELFWYCDGVSQINARERVLPTGNTQLIISLHDTPLRTFDTDDTLIPTDYHGPLLCGPHSRCSIIDTSPLSSCMGVQFKTGRAFPFFRAPAGELHNLNLTLDAMWGPTANEVHDRLREAKPPHTRFRILEEILLRQLMSKHEGHQAVDYALQEFHASPHDKSISEVTAHSGLSQRWLIEVFRDQVGLTPKVYCRLLRFQRALTSIGERQQVDWASLALDCGYYDQAHFNRDFRAFSGLCPKSYVKDRCAHQNHVRVSD